MLIRPANYFIFLIRERILDGSRGNLPADQSEATSAESSNDIIRRRVKKCKIFYLQVDRECENPIFHIFNSDVLLPVHSSSNVIRPKLYNKPKQKRQRAQILVFMYFTNSGKSSLKSSIRHELPLVYLAVAI